MTLRTVSLRARWGRPLAFLGATGIAIFGVVGAGSANAGNPPAPPDYTYSSAVTAIGVQVAIQRNPDFSSLPDPLDIEEPHSEAKLDSFGTSVADGHVINLNGLGGVPGLVCLAAGASTCNAIPIGQLTGGLISSFPPPDPVDAHASYPAHQSGKAPLIGQTPAQLAVDQGGFGLELGAAQATAHEYDTSTTANAQNLQIPGAVSIGSARTSTTQVATADSITTTAVASLSNVGLGGTLVNIGHVRSTTTVVSTPGKPPRDTTVTKLSDVTVAGLAATIDANGVTINKNGLPGNVVTLVQSAINKLLAQAGVKLSLSSITRTDDDNGHSVAASGLLITYDHAVSGAQPITVSLPPGVPCPIHFPVGIPDPCSGVSFTLDGNYHGQIALGQVGVVSMAQPGFDTGVGPGPGSSPGPVPSGGGSSVSPGSGPAFPTAPPSVTTSSSPPPPPVIAGRQQNVADQLTGVSHRIEWFFPLFALGFLALIGRFRIPARLPGPNQ